MRETEIKIPVKSFEAVRERLKKIGAKRVWHGMEHNIFFDTKRRKLEKRGAQLRVRRWRGHSDRITYKTIPARRERSYKEMNEVEIIVNNAREAVRIFRGLGFTEYFRYRKRREHWVLGRTAVELDAVRGKRFVEIEGTKANIGRIAKLLRLDLTKGTTKGYLAIVREK